MIISKSTMENRGVKFLNLDKMPDLESDDIEIHIYVIKNYQESEYIIKDKKTNKSLGILTPIFSDKYMGHQLG